MSEYCSLCFKEDISTGYDFNLYKLAKKLKKGYSSNFCCEGCTRRAVYRDEQGELHIAREQNKELVWESIELIDLKVTKRFRSWWFWRSEN